MRHKKGIKKLSKPTDQRLALLKSLSKSLITYKKIVTTDVRAKELKKFFERLVTVAKTDTVANRRKVFSVLQDRALTSELFNMAKESFSTLQGGYLIVLKKGHRRGDNALMSFVQTNTAQKAQV
eukprot:COSAG01_NODE_1_length_100484_cov_170.446142_65_plen_124_part_00